MNNQRQLLLGIFFIVALSILAFYTLFLTDMHVFSKPILMTVYFPDANGLREGDPVQVLGARIGRVKDLTADTAAEEKKRIRAVLSLDRKIELLQGAGISIRESSFLGGRHVDIDPGPFGGPPLQPLEDGAYFGSVRKNPIAMLADVGTLLNENREALVNFFRNADAIVADVRAGKGLLGRLIEDEQLGRDAAGTVANLREASDQMRSGEGLLGALIYDPDIKTRVTETFDNFRQVGSDLRAGRGVLGQLLYDEALRDKVTGGLESFANVGTRIDRGEGTLGRLISDDKLAQELDQVVANFKGASEDVRTITSQVREGQGSLGKLIANDEFYQEARRAVGLFSRSLEDYREAAPITAFTAVLFAAF